MYRPLPTPLRKNLRRGGVSVPMLGKGVSCGNIPVKIMPSASCFERLSLSYSTAEKWLDPRADKKCNNNITIIITYTSQNNKPLRHAVGRSINPHYMGLLLTCESIHKVIGSTQGRSVKNFCGKCEVYGKQSIIHLSHMCHR